MREPPLSERLWAKRGRVSNMQKESSTKEATMKNRSRQFRTVLALAIQIALAQLTSAATFTFAGPSGADWLLPASCSPAGPPGANDGARFFNPDAVAGTTSDAVVARNLTMQRLWM